MLWNNATTKYIILCIINTYIFQILLHVSALSAVFSVTNLKLPTLVLGWYPWTWPRGLTHVEALKNKCIFDTLIFIPCLLHYLIKFEHTLTFYYKIICVVLKVIEYSESATDWTDEDSALDCCMGPETSVFTKPTPAPRPKQPPVQRGTGGSSPREYIRGLTLTTYQPVVLVEECMNLFLSFVMPSWRVLNLAQGYLYLYHIGSVMISSTYLL
jgi:hypothetical protein